MFSANGTDMIMQLYDGHTREVASDAPASFRRVYFQRQVFGIPGISNQLTRNDRPDGYRGDREMTVGMLQAQIDTLARQRRDAVKELRQTALADLEFAVTGKAPPLAAGAPVADAYMPESTVASRTRRTADALANLRRQVEQVEESMRNYEVEIHKKYSIALASLVFVVVGAPLALRFGG